MKKSIEGFETQTEQELREVMGGSILKDIFDGIGGISLMYGIRPSMSDKPGKPGGSIIAKYGVFVPDSTVIK